MSDFDKEAERERLREKYENDQEQRQAAQRMSDLLLKGATMTNAHCGQCGSPVFRNEGEEFCPTCEESRGAAVEAAEEATGAAGDDAAEGNAAEPAGSDTDGTPAGRATDDAASEASDVGAVASDAGSEQPATDEEASIPVQTADATDSADTQPAANGGASTNERAPASEPRRTRTGRAAPSDANSVPERTQPREAGTDGRVPSEFGGQSTAEPSSLEAAREELLAAVIRHARAADTAEPRTARDHLEAAREAAEAVDALSR